MYKKATNAYAALSSISEYFKKQSRYLSMYSQSLKYQIENAEILIEVLARMTNYMDDFHTKTEQSLSKYKDWVVLNETGKIDKLFEQVITGSSPVKLEAKYIRRFLKRNQLERDGKAPKLNR